MLKKVKHVLILIFALFLSVSHASAEEPILGAVIFKGVTTFSASQLLSVYSDSLGQPTDSQQRSQLHTRVRDYYLDQGFLSPAVESHAHPDSPHILVVSVTEPRIVDVQLTGGTVDQRGKVRERLSPLRERAPISHHDVNRFTRALEKAVGVDLKPAIEETSPGHHQIAYTLKPQVHGELTYSAEGSQLLGQHMVAGKVSVLGLGAGVREIYLSGLHTLESGGYRNLGAGLSFAATEHDTLYADISASRAVPQNANISPSRVYRRIWSQLTWRHEAINSGTLKLTLDGSLSLRDYTRERGSVTEVDERLRMASIGALAYFRGQNRTSRVGLAGLAGVDALGAERSGPGANDALDLDFQAINAHYTLWQALPADFSLKLDVAGQYSGDNLPYSQRFAIGGGRYARAYEPGEFSGDSGLGSKLEFRRGFNSDRWIAGMRWVPYIYYGLATAYENESGDRDSAASSGLGLRFLTKEVSAYIEVGKPLTAHSEYKDKDPRLTGRITTYF